MKLASLGLIALFAGILGLTGLSTAQEPGDDSLQTGNAFRLIVVYKADAPSLTKEAAEQKARDFSERLNLEVEHVIRLPGNAQVILVRDVRADRNIKDIMTTIKRDPSVEDCELDSMMTTQPDG